MLYRKASGGGFDNIGRSRWEGLFDSIEVRAFSATSDQGYILAGQESGRYALYNYNFPANEIGELVYSNPTNDIDDFSLSDDGSTLESVSFTDGRTRTIWFDPVLKSVQEKIDQTFVGKINTITSYSRDKERFIIFSGAANDPGAYYLYMAGGALSRLAELGKGIDRSALSQTQYIHYTARDGLDIPAYLTLPKGRTPKGLPLIIMPHGGPYGVRDELGYDAQVQFLANRGYAVLQPNYRGSAGYGAAFYEKGEGEWGRKMQDDLDDGMDWLVEQGIVDPERVCLVGGSYGGYAALWGATRNPERYRCAVSFAGVSDLRAQLDHQQDFLVSRRYRKDWRNIVSGQKEFDLRSVSPLAQVEKLRVPVLIAHGDEDERVPSEQSTRYAKALEEAGKPHELYIYEGEGHGFSEREHETDYLKQVEAFLSKYNPAWSAGG